MAYTELIKQLKKEGLDASVSITIQTERKALNEQNWVTGEWRGKGYSLEVNTCWRNGELTCNEMDVEEVIKMLRKRKSLSNISSIDFNGFELNQTTDGDTDYGSIDWDEELTEEEQEEAPSASDLYWEGDISECEYSFGAGGLYSMTIECGDVNVTITE